jgi:PD-(D/E)XK endonuclease
VALRSRRRDSNPRHPVYKTGALPLSYSGDDRMVAVRFVVQNGNMEHPKDVGDKTTLAVMLALRMAGLTVLVPFGENTRYDLVFDDGGRFARVQCKTGRFRAGAVVFKTASSYAHHRSARVTRRGYHGECDYFGVYCPETGGVYLIPIADVPRTDGRLRVDPAINGQQKGIHPAEDYEFVRLHSWALREPKRDST